MPSIKALCLNNGADIRRFCVPHQIDQNFPKNKQGMMGFCPPFMTTMLKL